MAPFTEEAAKALELMPVSLLDHELDPEKAPRLETIKYTSRSLRKLGYPGYYLTGHGGVEEVIPHAIQTEAAINEWESIGELEKALAFKKSTAGNALRNANKALGELRVALANWLAV